MHPATLVDSHCHLTDGRLARQLEGVLARAEAAGVRALVSAGSDLPDSAAAARLAEAHPAVFFAAGIHPHQARTAEGDWLGQIQQLAAGERNVAIGEIGLDYHYDFSPREVQRGVFAAQLDLARRLGKPAIVHTREALPDTLAVLDEALLPGERVVFHSFTGGADDVRKVLDRGCLVGFSGIATFANAGELRRAAVLVPDDRILVETDSPYLSPEPVRRMKTNEPANVVHVARLLAAERNVAFERFAEQTTANAARFFGLPV